MPKVSKKQGLTENVAKSTLLKYVCRDLAHEIQLITKVLEEASVLIDIGRTHVLSDALREAVKRKFSVTKRIKV